MRARTLLFALTATALIGTALALGLAAGPVSSPRGRATPPLAGPSLHIGRLNAAERGRARAALSATAAADERELGPPAPRAQPRYGGVRAVARRFLAAFSRYEVGRLTPAVVRTLHLTCTSSFAAELLRAPPRQFTVLPHRAGVVGAPARVSLEVEFTAPGGLEAEATGTVDRGRAREAFAFRFVRTGRGWRASGIGA